MTTAFSTNFTGIEQDILASGQLLALENNRSLLNDMCSYSQHVSIVLSTSPTIFLHFSDAGVVNHDQIRIAEAAADALQKFVAMHMRWQNDDLPTLRCSSLMDDVQLPATPTAMFIQDCYSRGIGYRCFS